MPEMSRSYSKNAAWMCSRERVQLCLPWVGMWCLLKECTSLVPLTTLPCPGKLLVCMAEKNQKKQAGCSPRCVLRCWCRSAHICSSPINNQRLSPWCSLSQETFWFFKSFPSLPPLCSPPAPLSSPAAFQGWDIIKAENSGDGRRAVVVFCEDPCILPLEYGFVVPSWTPLLNELSCSQLQSWDSLGTVPWGFLSPSSAHLGGATHFCLLCWPKIHPLLQYLLSRVLYIHLTKALVKPLSKAKWVSTGKVSSDVHPKPNTGWTIFKCTFWVRALFQVPEGDSSSDICASHQTPKPAAWFVKASKTR